MVFIGERRGWELEVSTPGLAGNGGRRGWGAGAQNLLSYLGLGKTISYCSLFKKKKKLATCLGDLGSGATSVLQ